MKRKPPKPTLEDIWSLIPDVNCKGLCQESCGPIAMSVAEDRRLQARGVTVPPIMEAAADLHAYHCPALVDGRCSAYEDRPTICRMWGAIEQMPCPHGCTPPDALGPDAAREVLQLANHVGGGIAARFFKEMPHAAL